jgi:hypothetical protein
MTGEILMTVAWTVVACWFFFRFVYSERIENLKARLELRDDQLALLRDQLAPPELKAKIFAVR